MQGLLGELTAKFDPALQSIEPQYQLVVGDVSVDLNRWIGHGITLSRLDNMHCLHCAKRVTKLYGGGHCYDCFSTLARCDLCVMSPDRCHFHLGSCREPEWGESFCMQPHSVYLAITSGPKVGITRAGRERRRWLDQGAVEAIRIVSAPTRRAAGVVEAHLKRGLNDRTDWRKMVTGVVTKTNLLDLAVQVHRELELFTDLSTDILPTPEIHELAWEIDTEITTIRYPVNQYSPAKRLTMTEEEPQICDNLQGIIGQYLLLSQGVVNMSDYRGTDIEIELGPAFSAAVVNTSDQLSLFD